MCPITQLPSYTDDEVEVFHPIMETALNEALARLGLTDYEVEHHLQMGLIPDFVVRHKESKKLFLVVEVKRRPGDVASTRYRNQAKNYVTEAGNAVDRPYYVLTNLEITDLFYYDADRPAVSQQIIQPSTLIAGDFADTAVAVFYGNLVGHLVAILEVVFNGTPNFINQLGNLLTLLRDSAEQGNNWHGAFIPACYEYIKGSLNQSPELRRKLEQAGWRHAIDYRTAPNNLITSGLRFNFSSLFDEPGPEAYPQRPEIWNARILQECHEAGQKRRTGEDISDVVFSLIGTGHEYDGVVMTDPELARVLAVLARYYSGPLSEVDKIIDPAAGLGELLVSATQVFEDIQPSSLVANEIEAKFKEVLSLRLGLSLPHQVSPDNSPQISIADLLALPTDFFNGVKVMLLNPPYRRGTDAIPMKIQLFDRIQELTGESAKLDVGQLGYEWAFLETVVAYSHEDTVIAAIMPERLLFARSDESSAVRHFLLNHFGLQMIAAYPKENLFDAVIKKTMIIIGKKGAVAENIARLDFSEAIEGVNTARLLTGLEEGAHNPVPFTSNDTFERSVLVDNLNQGWSVLFDSRSRAGIWINDNLSTFLTIGQLDCTRRGRLANSGCAKLLYPTNSNIWETLEELIPEQWLSIGLCRTRDLNSPLINSETVTPNTFVPLADSFEPGTANNIRLMEIIDQFIPLNHQAGRQERRALEPERVFNILRLESRRFTEPRRVLVGRNQRRFARAFVVEERAYISSNVFEIDFSGMPDEYEYLLLSWMKSVFAHIQIEAKAVNQEGTAKIEKTGVELIRIPDFSQITDEHARRLVDYAKELDFLDLQNLSPNDNDRLWSEILFGQDAQEALETATEILSNLVADRGR